MLHITKNKHFVQLAHVKPNSLVTIVARKLTNGLIEIRYVGNGVRKTLQSASLLAPRMIASLLGADYDMVNEALVGVA